MASMSDKLLMDFTLDHQSVVINVQIRGRGKVSLPGGKGGRFSLFRWSIIFRYIDR